jgi:hypothetical protein
MRLDAYQCLEVSNCSSLHLSGHRSNASGCFSKFKKNPEFKCIRPDDVADIIRMPVNVRQVKGFPLRAQIWEDRCIRPKVSSTLSKCYP